MSMSVSDPFSRRFEVFGRDPQDLVISINQSARDLLKSYLREGSQGEGRVILLQAPRAGYGKTTLLQSIATDLGESHRFVRIQLTNGRTTDAAHVLEYVLQSLCEVVSESGTLTQLDLLAREVLALGLEPLVASGEVPCQDRESALESLRDNPAQTFDFHYDGAVTAHWTKTNFEVLGPRLAAELARISGASLREASYWVELLFRFATTPPDNVERARLLFETIFRNDLQNQSSSTAEERLHGLLSLISTVACPVLIVDDTEGLSTSPQDALALASFLSNISQSCPGAIAILSVNDDIWASSFLPNLPGGLADRLLAYRVTLEALTAEEVEAIISARAGKRAAEVLGKIDWSASGEPLYPRRIVELASSAWAELEHPIPEAKEVKEVENSVPDSASDTRSELQDVGANPLAEVHAEGPRQASHKRQEAYAEKVLDEDVPVLTPEASGQQSFESPMIPAPEFGERASASTEDPLSGSAEHSVGMSSPFEVVMPATDGPSPAFPTPFEQKDIDEGYPSGPTNFSDDEAPVDQSPPARYQDEERPPRPFRSRSADHGYQSSHLGSDEASLLENADKGERGGQTPSPFIQDEQDPTRGEIEFSKLKPLSEKPVQSSHFEDSSAPGSAESEGDAFVADGRSSSEADFSAPDYSNGNQELPDSLPEPDPCAPRDPMPMSSPFEPQAMDPVESPFSAVHSESASLVNSPEGQANNSHEIDSLDDFSQVAPPTKDPIEPSRLQAENPAVRAPDSEPSSGEPAKEWWPGDPSDTREQGVAETPSPFVAVGTPPKPLPHAKKIEARTQPRSVDPAATDREEVERMLKLLRERQDNH